MSARRLAGRLGLCAALLAAACAPSPEPAPEPTPRGPLPALPDLGAAPAPVAAHLRAADATARAEPGAEATGALGLAYHADLFSREAAHAYTTASELAPEEWRWTWYRMLLHQDRGEHEELIRAATSLTERLPEQQLPWFYLGRALAKLGRDEAATAAWRSALAANLRAPSHAALAAVPRRLGTTAAQHASLGLARLAMRRGDEAGAEITLRALLAGDARFGPGQELLAELLRRQGRDREARVADYAGRLAPAYSPPVDPFVDALVLESASTEFLLRAAGVAKVAGDRAWWKRAIERAAELEPEDLEVLSVSGDLALSEGRVEDALARFERYHELRPDEAVALEAAAACLLRLGRVDEAEARLLQALALDPHSSPANLAVVYEQQGRVEEALAAWSRTIEANPDSAGAHRRLAEHLVRQRLLPDAERHLARVVELHPLDPDARVRLASVQMMLGQCSPAALHFGRALEVRPGDGQALGQLAWIQATCVDEAVRDGQAALATARALCALPGQHELQCLRTTAAAQAELGQRDEAVATAERLVRQARATRPGPVAAEMERLRDQIRAGTRLRTAPPTE